MKVPLTTQTKFVNAIISLKDKSINAIKGAIIHDLTEWCVDNCELYAMILHDKDVDDNGELKTPHIHLLCLLKTNRKRLSTTLLAISNACCVSTLAISIEKLNDVGGSIQYLIHKNNENKHEYDRSEIITNLTENELDVYMTNENGSMSIDKLIDVCRCCKNKVEIMRMIGLGYYHLYRNEIADILDFIRKEKYHRVVEQDDD